MYPILYPVIKRVVTGVIAAAVGAFIYNKNKKDIDDWARKVTKNRKALLTGPIASGKTTFAQHISEEEIPSGASGAPRQYKVKNAVFDLVTDFSGDKSWLKAKFEEYINTNNYILFFFDINEYISDLEYREDVNARVDLINKKITDLQFVVMIGTHSDKAHGNYQTEVESLFAGKPYQKMLRKLVYVDTRKQECVKIICDKLKS